MHRRRLKPQSKSKSKVPAATPHHTHTAMTPSRVTPPRRVVRVRATPPRASSAALARSLREKAARWTTAEPSQACFDLTNCSAEDAQDVVHLIESKENRLCDAQKAIQNSSGVWEVFYMPHIRSIAEPLGMKVAPLRYRFSKDNSIETEVRIQLGSLVDVWLSADGVVCTRPDGNLGDCYIRFDNFDVSRGDDGPPQRNSDSLLTKTVNAIGKLFFFEELSRFPVHVFEDDVCVFAFPPLKSYIATYRIQSADD